MKLISIKDTSEILGVGSTKLYALIKEKKLEMVKIGRKSLIVSDSIDVFLKGVRNNAA